MSEKAKRIVKKPWINRPTRRMQPIEVGVISEWTDDRIVMPAPQVLQRHNAQALCHENTISLKFGAEHVVIGAITEHLYERDEIGLINAMLHGGGFIAHGSSGGIATKRRKNAQAGINNRLHPHVRIRMGEEKVVASVKKDQATGLEFATRLLLLPDNASLEKEYLPALKPTDISGLRRTSSRPRRRRQEAERDDGKLWALADQLQQTAGKKRIDYSQHFTLTEYQRLQDLGWFD